VMHRKKLNPGEQMWVVKVRRGWLIDEGTNPNHLTYKNKGSKGPDNLSL